MRLSAPIHRLKRAARDHARANAIPLHAALDHVASGEGYSSWSLLTAKSAVASSVPHQVYASFKPGELILVAARPLQGKTRFTLQLALAALAAGHTAHFFSLDYTTADVADRLRGMHDDLARHAPGLGIDCSDAISAEHITTSLATAPREAFVAVDHLQLLDQRRTNPPLQDQIETLAAFARSHGHVIAFVCQIDRQFDATHETLPGPADIRLPNPLDLGLFDRAIFLHGSILGSQALR